MNQPELVYWKGSGEVRSDLMQAIKIVGYRLTTISDIDEIIARNKNAYPGLILVDASGGEAEASQRVVEMSAATKLAAVPIIFLSYQATKRSAVLKKTFSCFQAVDIPFKLQDLLTKLVEFCPVAPAPLEEKEGHAPKPEEQNSPSESSDKEKQSSLVLGKGGLRTAILNKDPTNLKASCGGEFFGLAESLDRIDDSLVIPSHPNYDQLVKTLRQMTENSYAAGLRARRVSYLAAAISKALGMNGEDQRSVRIAGLFLNWGISEKYSRLINHDLLLSQDDKTNKIIGGAIAASANYVRDNIKDEQAARTIDNISRIILRFATGQEEDMLSAHCALAPELADRSTWSGSKWNSSGAHRAVRKLSDGQPYVVHKPVANEITRVLSEASTARRLLHPISNPLIDKPEDPDSITVLEAVGEAEKLFGNTKKSNQLIIDLKAGMKLAEPVVSFSGKLLLKANVSLTDELIQNLWRTSVINPVKASIAISA